MIHVKEGVTPRNLIIAAAAANAAEDMRTTVTITSGTDGKHMVGSKHYTSEALDFRLLADAALTLHFMGLLRTRLGPAYQVILESDHVHTEYDVRHLQ